MITALRDRTGKKPEELASDPYCKFYLPLWKLDGDSFADHSAYGHLCTSYGSIWTPRGRSFDGVDDYVDCGLMPQMQVPSGTFEFWFNPTVTINSGSGEIRIVSQNRLEFRFVPSDGRLHLRIYDEPDTVYRNLYTTQNSWVAGTWYHITGSWSPTGMRLHVDSNQVASENNDAYPQEYTYTLSIGSGYGPNYQFKFNGLIGLVLIYSRALTPQEILDHYLVGKEMFG